MKYFLLWAIGLLAFSSHAQVAVKRDSLLALARDAGQDTARVWAWMEAGKLYLQTQPDSALLYIDQALALAKEIAFERGIAKCCINRSFALNNLARYQESVAECRIAIPICERLGLHKELVAAYNNMGNAWDYLGNRWMAIDAFSKALKAMEGVKLPPNFPLTVRNGLARQYNDLRLYEKGFEYARQSVEDARAMGDSNAVAASLQIMAHSAMSVGREAEALGYCQRIYAIAKAADDPKLQVFALNNMSVLSFDKQPELSARMRMEALQLARSSGDVFGMVAALENLAQYAIYQREFKAARGYAMEAMEKAKQGSMADEIARCYQLQADLALVDGDVAQYRVYRQLFQDTNDTLAGNALVRATQELETRYETEKKEQQIVQLEQQRALQQLRLRQKNGLIAGLAGFSVLLLLAGFLVVRNLRQRRRLAEQELQLQQQQIIQLKQEQQLSVADAVLQSQENERSRLARDLHDGLGGMLSGIKQSLNVMKGNQVLTETAARALGQVIDDLDRSIGELRHIARNMMPEALVRFGLRDALHDYCDHLRLSNSLPVHFQAYGLDDRLPQQTEVILFRVAQELLNNIIKHADATQILVQLMEGEGQVNLTIEDNGKGFDAEALKTAPGVGWLNIRSRIEYLNGVLDLKSAPGKGTSVHVSVPL